MERFHKSSIVWKDFRRLTISLSNLNAKRLKIWFNTVMPPWGKYEISTYPYTYGLSNMYEALITIKILKQVL